MVNSQFGTLLKEFENYFHCNLEPDENNSCLIQMGIGISIQIEMDRYGLLLIGCRLGSIQTGKYRENLIKQALKSNEATLPSTGILGYSRKSNQLILFTKLDPNHLTANQILNLFPLFTAKAKLWIDAITKGEIPILTSSKNSKSPSGIFGLISK